MSATSPGSARVRLEEQRPVGRVEEVDAADRDRADRVPVVGVAQVDERGAAHVLAAALLPVLEGHLQRDLGRRRARVRVEDAAQPRRRDLDQARGQLGGARVGEPEHRRVGDLVELVAHRAVDERVAVAVDVAPERGDAVDVAAPVAVDQVGALGPLDHQRLLRAPIALLGEGVPEVALVELAGGRPTSPTTLERRTGRNRRVARDSRELRENAAPHDSPLESHDDSSSARSACTATVAYRMAGEGPGDPADPRDHLQLGDLGPRLRRSSPSATR